MYRKGRNTNPRLEMKNVVISIIIASLMLTVVVSLLVTPYIFLVTFGSMVIVAEYKKAKKETIK